MNVILYNVLIKLQKWWWQPRRRWYRACAGGGDGGGDGDGDAQSQSVYLESSHISLCKWDTIKMSLYFYFKTLNSLGRLHTVRDIVPYNWDRTAECMVTLCQVSAASTVDRRVVGDLWYKLGID